MMTEASHLIGENHVISDDDSCGAVIPIPSRKKRTISDGFLGTSSVRTEGMEAEEVKRDKRGSQGATTANENHYSSLHGTRPRRRTKSRDGKNYPRNTRFGSDIGHETSSGDEVYDHNYQRYDDRSKHESSASRGANHYDSDVGNAHRHSHNNKALLHVASRKISRNGTSDTNSRNAAKPDWDPKPPFQSSQKGGVRRRFSNQETISSRRSSAHDESSRRSSMDNGFTRRSNMDSRITRRSSVDHRDTNHAGENVKSRRSSTKPASILSSLESITSRRSLKTNTSRSLQKSGGKDQRQNQQYRRNSGANNYNKGNAQDDAINHSHSSEEENATVISMPVPIIKAAPLPTPKAHVPEDFDPDLVYEPWIHRRDSGPARPTSFQDRNSTNDNLKSRSTMRSSSLPTKSTGFDFGTYQEVEKYIPNTTTSKEIESKNSEYRSQSAPSSPQPYLIDHSLRDKAVFPTLDIACTELDSMRNSLLLHHAKSSTATGKGKTKANTSLPTRRSFPSDLLSILRLFEGNDQCCDCGRCDLERGGMRMQRRLSALASGDCHMKTGSGTDTGTGADNLLQQEEQDAEKDLPIPTWASVTYGTLLCDKCAFRHINRGDEKQFREISSNVKSLKEGDWTLPDVIAMMEGGNQAMLDFMDSSSIRRRASIDITGTTVRRISLLGSTNIVATQSSKDLDAAYNSAYEARYKSKSASTYRKNLARRVQDVISDYGCDGSKSIRPVRPYSLYSTPSGMPSAQSRQQHQHHPRYSNLDGSPLMHHQHQSHHDMGRTNMALHSHSTDTEDEHGRTTYNNLSDSSSGHDAVTWVHPRHSSHRQRKEQYDSTNRNRRSTANDIQQYSAGGNEEDAKFKTQQIYDSDARRYAPSSNHGRQNDRNCSPDPQDRFSSNQQRQSRFSTIFRKGD